MPGSRAPGRSGLLTALGWLFGLAAGLLAPPPFPAAAAAAPSPPLRQAKRIQRVLEALAPTLGVIVNNPEGSSSADQPYTLNTDLPDGHQDKPGDQTYSISARVFPTEDQARQYFDGTYTSMLAGEYFPYYYFPPSKGEPFDVAPGQQAIVGRTEPNGANIDNYWIDNQIYAWGSAHVLMRWQTATLWISKLRISSTGYAQNSEDLERDVLAPEMAKIGDALKAPTIELAKKLYATLDRLQALDQVPALSAAGANLVTGEGTPNRVEWSQPEAAARVPLAKVPYGDFSQPFSPAKEALAGLPEVSGRGGGQFRANWARSTWGLELGEVEFTQSLFFDGEEPLTPATHSIVDSLQWRNFRLFFEQGGAAAQQFILSTDVLTDVLTLTQPGTRSSDGKRFAWGVAALGYPPLLDGPPGSGAKYLVEITQVVLCGAPERDQDPAGKVLAIKLFPTLTAKIIPILGDNPPHPSFAADVKLIFAPRPTRRDESRPPEFDLSPPGLDRLISNVASLTCDTNDNSRPTPGLTQPPYWDIMFDYVQPDIAQTMEVNAVVYPRDEANTEPFQVNWAGAWPTAMLLPNPLRNGKLTVRRAPGQGEFDNLHIHPYLGFDDPIGATETRNRSYALIEAPLAADEVVHMHWRWGSVAASLANPEFYGYSDAKDPQSPGGEAHQQPLASMIPANQSLRIKIGRADEDDSKPEWDYEKTAVWYKATVHEPVFGAPSQFFENGFALGYHLDDLLKLETPSFKVALTNADLLSGSVPAPGSSYHAFRWASFVYAPSDFKYWQRVPTASDLPGLKENHLHKASGPNDPVLPKP